MEYNIPKNSKVYAKLTYWNGTVETIEIRPEFIDDIVSAVQGQYYFVNNKTGLVIHGENIYHVDIYYE